MPSITVVTMPKSSSLTNTNNETNERKRHSNDGDSGAGGADHGMIDHIGDGNKNKKLKIEYANENNTNAVDDGEKTDDEESIKDDDDSPTSDDSTWEYKETEIHKILTRDLWRTDLTELDVKNYMPNLLNLSVVIDNANHSSPIKSSQEIFYRLGGSTILIGIMNKC